MRRSSLLRLVLFLLGLASLGGPALACSVAEGYRIPTNYELVREADLIVLATVESGPAGLEGQDPWTPNVVIRPLRALKGSLPDAPLKLPGTIAMGDVQITPLPTTLDQSHFSAGMGACVRMLYPKGGLVVAMFKQRAAKGEMPAGLYPLVYPFSRAVEDVEGADGVWVQAVEEYVALQEADPAGEAAPIAARRAELAAKPDDILAQAIADDLAAHLARASGEPNPRKGIRWTLYSDVYGASLSITDRKAQSFVGLVCRRGGDIRLTASGEAGPQLSLLLDGEVVVAEGSRRSASPKKPIRAGFPHPRCRR